MFRVFALFAATLIVAPQSSAEIYKCTAKNGLPLYQNFPCEIDSPRQPPGPALDGEACRAT